MLHSYAWRPASLLFLLAGLSFAGCKKSSPNSPCPLALTGPLPFGLAFSTDTLGTGTGFRKAEAFSAYLVRYRGTNLTEPLDTLRAQDKVPRAFTYLDKTMFLNILATGGSDGFHSYRLAVPAAQRSYDITDIVLEYGGLSDCTRNINRLDALVNGQRVDARRGYTITK
ncbi:hypothetical protein [Hymenobacter psoromatis]|uniref:hypothetical protein n=1 Tax=Hymenobacter psoromatis TaxID=1484116 RepID=UPI001CC096E4|nr:hypothetical protein [Hymenobacter psoromatis]